MEFSLSDQNICSSLDLGKLSAKVDGVKASVASAKAEADNIKKDLAKILLENLALKTEVHELKDMAKLLLTQLEQLESSYKSHAEVCTNTPLVDKGTSSSWRANFVSSCDSMETEANAIEAEATLLEEQFELENGSHSLATRSLPRIPETGSDVDAVQGITKDMDKSTLTSKEKPKRPTWMYA